MLVSQNHGCWLLHGGSSSSGFTWQIRMGELVSPLHGEGTLACRNRRLGHCLVSILNRNVSSACPKCPIVLGWTEPFLFLFIYREPQRAEGSERSSWAYKEVLGKPFCVLLLLTGYCIYPFYSTLSVTM